MNKVLLIIIVSLITWTGVFAQIPGESTPAGARETMLKFIELNNKQLLKSDEARHLLTGEAAKWNFAWFGQTLGQPDKIVSIEKDYSVARVQIVEQNSRVTDLYFYLTADNGWKIRFMRSLAQTGFLETINTGLKNKTILTAEEKETLINTGLTLLSDKLLTEWFQRNRLALDKLSSTVKLETKKKPVKPKVLPVRRKNKKETYAVVETMKTSPMEENEPHTIDYIGANTQKFPKSAAALKNLHLSALETKSNGNIEIIIGGITDNSVGFIYSPKGAPPQIDGWRYIWVERVAPGWYLFRTT